MTHVLRERIILAPPASLVRSNQRREQAVEGEPDDTEDDQTDEETRPLPTFTDAQVSEEIWSILRDAWAFTVLACGPVAIGLVFWMIVSPFLLAYLASMVLWLGLVVLYPVIACGCQSCCFDPSRQSARSDKTRFLLWVDRLFSGAVVHACCTKQRQPRAILVTTVVFAAISLLGAHWAITGPVFDVIQREASDKIAREMEQIRVATFPLYREMADNYTVFHLGCQTAPQNPEVEMWVPWAARHAPDQLRQYRALLDLHGAMAPSLRDRYYTVLNYWSITGNFMEIVSPELAEWSISVVLMFAIVSVLSVASLSILWMWYRPSALAWVGKWSLNHSPIGRVCLLSAMAVQFALLAVALKTFVVPFDVIGNPVSDAWAILCRAWTPIYSRAMQVIVYVTGGSVGLIGIFQAWKHGDLLWSAIDVLRKCQRNRRG